MKISRRSWHYKLYRYVDNIEKGPRYLNPFAGVERTDPAPPSSLCPYAWLIFLGLAGTVVIAAVLIAAAVPAGICWAVYRFGCWVNSIPWPFASQTERPEQAAPAKTKRGPSLVASFVRSRKEKVCPILELVD